MISSMRSGSMLKSRVIARGWFLSGLIRSCGAIFSSSSSSTKSTALTKPIRTFPPSSGLITPSTTLRLLSKGKASKNAANLIVLLKPIFSARPFLNADRCFCLFAAISAVSVIFFNAASICAACSSSFLCASRYLARRAGSSTDAMYSNPFAIFASSSFSCCSSLLFCAATSSPFVSFSHNSAYFEG